MWSREYNDCLEYIDSFWNTVIHKPTKRKVLSIPHIDFRHTGGKTNRHIFKIPYTFITPNDKKFNTIFYWDSYFMFRGLLGTKRSHLMKSMVNNFRYLFKTYNIIPNSNHAGFANRSQPPLFTSMILDAYSSTAHSGIRQSIERKILSQKKWLHDIIESAKKEYFLVWIDSENAYNHSVKGYSLARYGDRDIGYAHSSELESGWDFTSRFYNRCNEFLPIDLNVFLYKYEKDFALTAALLKKPEEISEWNKAAEVRKEEINKYMWNSQEGFFFDYGYNYKKQSNFYSLAGFTPLWAKLATPMQAEKMVDKLSKFYSPYGLTITAKESLAPKIDLTNIQKRYHPAINEIVEPKQWDYPNIWSPLEYLTVIGLLNYGYVKEAREIMENSVKAHAALFRKYGTFFEKINGETGEYSATFHYAGQQGFGWTNAVFYRYIKILDDMDSGKNIYIDSKNSQSPYELSLLH